MCIFSSYELKKRTYLKYSVAELKAMYFYLKLSKSS